MKRYVLAGFFVLVGLILLGAVTANVMKTTDESAVPKRPAATNETPKAHGPSQQERQQLPQQGKQGVAPFLMQAKPAPATPLGFLAPVSTTVPAPTIHAPPPQSAPRVPILPQYDESTTRGK